MPERSPSADTVAALVETEHGVGLNHRWPLACKLGERPCRAAGGVHTSAASRVRLLTLAQASAAAPPQPR
jgi:hypothetical protein